MKKTLIRTVEEEYEALTKRLYRERVKRICGVINVKFA
jgi:hypothetical protein